jgi:hypothetical protein
MQDTSWDSPRIFRVPTLYLLSAHFTETQRKSSENLADMFF